MERQRRWGSSVDFAAKVGQADCRITCGSSDILVEVKSSFLRERSEDSCDLIAAKDFAMWVFSLCLFEC
jgi:hypothetical protein